MTEAEWLASEDSAPMLRLFRDQGHERKRLLLASACWRRKWGGITDAATLRVLEATEARGEGSMTFDELVQQIEALRSDRPADPTTMTARATFHSLCWPPFITPMHIDAVLRGIATATAFDNTASLHLPNRRRSAEYRAALRAEHTAQCNLLRCIFGNPFRPVFFSPAWRSETAVALATAIYAERAFDRLPILADALEEAGCDHADSLAHCRGPGPHARGCWVVDAVLGKL